uniref:Uncharacterized protein n=1 Tax=Aureoumbra lagunensis TaxID=44058 RepID=A0A7S3JVN1_9STRA|mmetsp:Transcript_11899/g.16120  ORF Transcript_11899/g.16120 Transcript_11899/m.16120 type:complete len:326 (-) Transcript_11899:2-979(-)
MSEERPSGIVVIESTHVPSCGERITSWYAYALTLPIIAPVLFVGAVIGFQLTRRSLNRVLRSFEDDLGVDHAVTDDIKRIADAWLSYTTILDIILVITTVLTSGVLRDWLRKKLHKRMLQFQSFILGFIFFIAYLGQYIAILFCLGCCVLAFVAFVIHEACEESSSKGAEYAVAFLAQQINKYTSIDIVFCTVNVDDIIGQFEGETDDNVAFSDDDSCLPSISDFCKPYIHGIYRNSIRLAFGSGLVALVQINFALLALERYRTMTPLITKNNSSNGGGRTRSIEQLPDSLRNVDDARLLSSSDSLINPLLSLSSQQEQHEVLHV